MARILMNATLASDGYPSTGIRVEDRTACLEALDRASIDMDFKTLFAFVGERVQRSLERRELRFPAPEERCISDRGVGVFWGHAGNRGARVAKSAHRLWKIISQRITNWRYSGPIGRAIE
jgi:hypothetical protein